MQENNMNYPKFKVCVRCFTFNQAKYITDALNGFTMQQTDFPFVCCIVDDASTDGEQQVIMEYVQEHFDMSDASVSYRKETDYADITYAQHKANKNCYFAVLLLKENHYSQRKDKMPYLSEWRDNTEYEALCEGDDYWIHPKKLQMQVDFLEANPEYMLCFSNALVIYDDSSSSPCVFNNLRESREILMSEIINNWIIPTASIFIRHSVYDFYPKWAREIYSGDQTLALVARYRGGVYYFNKITTVYRKNAEQSMSLSMKNKLVTYIYGEHIKLYVYFNEYTDFKYQDIISSKIKRLKLTSSYVKDRQVSLLYAVLRNPMYVFCKVFKLF